MGRGMHLTGYFKLGQLPSAGAGIIILGLSAAAGFLHVAWLSPYRRQVLGLSPWSLARQQAQQLHERSFDTTWREQNVMALPRMQPNATLAARSALSWSYAASCVAMAIVLLHAVVFPLYKATSRTRYKHQMQDSLAFFGWFFLSLHHLANLATLLILLFGPGVLAPAAPFALLLPLAHLAVVAASNWVPPSLHFKLGSSLDWTMHSILLVLYLWRAALLSKWEAVGVAAEALHLASILPEYLYQRRVLRRHTQEGPTSSYYDPFKATRQRKGQVDTATSAREVDGLKQPHMGPFRGRVDPASGPLDMGMAVQTSVEYQVEIPSSSFEVVDAPPEEAPNAATEPLRRSEDVAEGYEPLFPDQPITGVAGREGLDSEDTIGARVAARHRQSGSTGTSFQERSPGVPQPGTGASCVGGVASSSASLRQRVTRTTQGLAGAQMFSSPDTPAHLGSMPEEIGTAAAARNEAGGTSSAAAAYYTVTPTPGLGREGLLNKVRRRLFPGSVDAVDVQESPGTAAAHPPPRIREETEGTTLQDQLRRVEEMARQGEEAQQACGALLRDAKQRIRKMREPRLMASVYMLLLLIANAASFFCYGGLMAITSAPPHIPTPSPVPPQLHHPFLFTPPQGFPSLSWSTASIEGPEVQRAAAAGGWKEGKEAVEHFLAQALSKVQQATQTVTFQKAEQAAKIATQEATRAYFDAGPAVREQASTAVGALNAAKEDLQRAAHDAQQAVGQLLLGAGKDTAELLQQQVEAAWEAAVRAETGVQEAAQALQQKLAEGQDAAAKAVAFRCMWGRASQPFTSAGRWLAHIRDRILNVLSRAFFCLSRQEPAIEAKQAVLQAAQSAKHVTSEATDAAVQTASDAAHAAADAKQDGADALTAAKPQAEHAAQEVSDTAQAATQRVTDAAHAAAHTATGAAHTAVNMTTDAAHAAADAYHAVQPVAKQAALDALHTAKAAEEAAEAAARRASEAASDAYHVAEPVAKRAAMDAWHTAQASADEAAATAAHVLERAQTMIREAPHAARELLHHLGGASHDVYERARNILTAVYTNPTIRALVHSAAAGSKAAAADCRDACRALSAGAVHLSKEAFTASNHMGKDLRCAACQAEQDLWTMIEQVAAGLHRVGEQVSRGAQSVRHAGEA